MSGSLVQAKGFSFTAVTSGTAAFVSTVTVGNVIEVFAGTINDPANSITGVSDNKGNTYSRKATGMTTSGGGTQFNSADIWVADVATGGTGVIVTIAYTGSTNPFGLVVEISGTTVSGFDQTTFGTAFSAASSYTSGTVTTTSANEYMNGFIYASSIATVTITPDSGWTQSFNYQDSIIFSAQIYYQDRNVSATSSYQASGTNTGNIRYLDTITTFVTSGGPPPTSNNRIQQVNFF